jgi:Nuclease-related domain/TadE-like protein
VTARVVDCRDGVRARARPAVAPRPATGASGAGRRLAAAAAAALLVVPIAGAAERPYGWLVAAATALAVLGLVAVVGQRARWGWVTALVAGAALAVPRGDVPVVGPALLVVSAMCLMVWLAGPAAAARASRSRQSTAAGAREREAQLVMGMSGERHVGHVLARELPDEYVLINGLKLPRAPGDIDHLVVGPNGLFLLETKTMAGRIVCEPDGTWRRTRVGRAGTAYAAYIGDPAAQVQRNIFAVRACLRRRLPGLVRHTPLWIEGLVVFAHPRTELEAGHSHVPAVRLQDATPYIRTHVPRQVLQAGDVDRLVGALLAEAEAGPIRVVPAAQSAQALVECALILPLVLALLFGTVALSRVIQAQTAVVAVAHEAARAGSLAASGADAVARMRQRARLVAPGLGLDPQAVELEYDVSRFALDPGQVVALVHYPVDLHDVPLAGWAPPPVVHAEHVEWVDPFRAGSRLNVEAGP